MRPIRNIWLANKGDIVFFNEGLVGYQTYTGEVDEFANSWEQILNYFNRFSSKLFKKGFFNSCGL